MAIRLVPSSHAKRCNQTVRRVAVDQEQGIAPVLITPATAGITVSHHDEAFRLDVIFLHVGPVAHEVSAATTLDFVFVDFIDVFGRELGIVVDPGVKAPHFQVEVNKLLHNALGFAEQVAQHILAH